MPSARAGPGCLGGQQRIRACGIYGASCMRTNGKRRRKANRHIRYKQMRGSCFNRIPHPKIQSITGFRSFSEASGNVGDRSGSILGQRPAQFRSSNSVPYCKSLSLLISAHPLKFQRKKGLWGEAGEVEGGKGQADKDTTLPAEKMALLVVSSCGTN